MAEMENVFYLRKKDASSQPAKCSFVICDLILFLPFFSSQ